MTITEYRKRARERIESGEMSDAEWEEITMAILHTSENDGLPLFDDIVDPQRQRTWE